MCALRPRAQGMSGLMKIGNPVVVCMSILAGVGLSRRIREGLGYPAIGAMAVTVGSGYLATGVSSTMLL